jgi:hypothetical protein
VAVTQSHYRFGIDEGTESTHGWHAAEDANPSAGVIPINTTFLLRFCLQCDGTAQSNVDAEFQVRRNGGAYQNITTSSSIVRAVATVAFANGDNTTKRLSGTGTFESSSAGCTEDGVSGGTAFDIVSNGNGETECSLQIVGADVADGDVLEFRLTRDGGTQLDTYAVTPSLTVVLPQTLLQPMPVRGYNAIRSRSAEFARAAIAAGLLLHVAGFVDGPLPTQPETWTQEVVGARAWSGLKSWPAGPNLAAGDDVAPTNQPDTYTQPIPGTRSLGRSWPAGRAALTQGLRMTAGEVPPSVPEPDTWVVEIPIGVRAWQGLKAWPAGPNLAAGYDVAPANQESTWTQPVPGVTALARAATASRRLVTLTGGLRSNIGEIAPPESDTWTAPLLGTAALRLGALSRGRAISASRLVLWSLPEEDGPLALQESTWTVEIPVGVRAWQGLKSWPAGPNLAAGYDVAPANQESTWTSPIGGTTILRTTTRVRWARASASSLVRSPAAWDPIAAALEESTWTQRTPGTWALGASARAFASRAHRATTHLRASDRDGEALTESGWQGPVFHPAQYQNLVWLLWYGASVGADNAPLDQQPDTYAQPIPGTSCVRRAIQQRAQLAGRSIALRQFGAGDQAAAPEEPTWAQPTSGTRAIRVAAAARARALSAARLQIWTTAQDADAPLPTQESTWTQQVPGTRALAASTRLAWRVAATQLLRSYSAFDPLTPPPEESTWTQPASGAGALRIQAARATVRAAIARARLSDTAQDVDGPLAAQPDTWLQPLPGTRALEGRRRALQAIAAATVSQRSARTDEASAEEPASATTSAIGTHRWLTDAAARRSRVRAFGLLVWSGSADIEQEPATPWTQPVVGTAALRQMAALRSQRAALVTRHAYVVPGYDDGPLPAQPDTWVSPIGGTRSLRARAIELWRLATRFLAWGSRDDRIESTPVIARVGSYSPTLDRSAEYSAYVARTADYQPTIDRVGGLPEG